MVEEKRRIVEVGDRVMFWPTTHHKRSFHPGEDYLVCDIDFRESRYADGKEIPCPKYAWMISCRAANGKVYRYESEHFLPCLEHVVFDLGIFEKEQAAAKAAQEAEAAKNFHMSLSEL